MQGADDLPGDDRRYGHRGLVGFTRRQDASVNVIHSSAKVAESGLTFDRVIDRQGLKPRYGSGWQPVSPSMLPGNGR